MVSSVTGSRRKRGGSDNTGIPFGGFLIKCQVLLKYSVSELINP
jgi:hypothetical protein